MPSPPKRVAGSDAQAAWLNKLLDYVKSLRPLNSPNVNTHHTVNGVKREAKAKGSTSGTSDFVWL